jgi:hypothetical protein
MCVIAGQDTHELLPINGLYVVVAHGTHAPASDAYPALHKHSASSTAPSKLVMCAGQAVHAAKPGLGLKRPAAHIAHVPPSAVHPAAHVQVLLSVVSGDAHKDTRAPKAVRSSPSASTASSLQTGCANTHSTKHTLRAFAPYTRMLA